MFILLLSLLFSETQAANKIKVIFGGSEAFPVQIFKDKKLAGKGAFQIASQLFLEGTQFEAQWIEMTNLRQQKELSKKQLFCRVKGTDIDRYNTKRGFSNIENYVAKDLSKVKFNIKSTLTLWPFYVPGFVTVRKNKIELFKKYFNGETYHDLPALDGKKLTNQKELTTGFIPAGNGIPPMLIDAGIKKKIIALETVMDYHHNFFRMVESNRIDFFIDNYGEFLPGKKGKQTYLKKLHNELDSLVSLRVKDFDMVSLGLFQCTADSTDAVTAMNTNIKKIMENRESFRSYVYKIFHHVYSKEEIESTLERSMIPGIEFMKAYNSNKAITVDLFPKD